MKTLAQRTQKPAREKIDNTELLKTSGCRVRHFHAQDRYGFPRVRSMTVAFKEGHSNIEIATAVVHPSDTFSRKMGTKLAVESFLAGKTIKIPKVMDFSYDGSGRRPASACATLGVMFNA